MLWQIDQLSEGNNPYAQLLAVLLDHLLCVVWAVERLASRIISWASVVSTYDEVVCSEVPSYDGVQHSFTRPSHSHSQGQERQKHTVTVEVVLRQCFVRAHAGEVVNVAFLGHPYYGVKQQHAIDFFYCPFDKLFVNTMHRVTGLECHDIGVTVLAQPVAGFRRSQAQLLEIVVSRYLQYL